MKTHQTPVRKPDTSITSQTLDYNIPGNKKVGKPHGKELSKVKSEIKREQK